LWGLVPMLCPTLCPAPRRSKQQYLIGTANCVCVRCRWGEVVLDVPADAITTLQEGERLVVIGDQ
jgi:hypothetical protein